MPFCSTARLSFSSIEYTDSRTTCKTAFVYGANDFLGQIKRIENSAMVSDVRIARESLLALQARDASNPVMGEYIWGANKGGGIGDLLNLTQNGMNQLGKG